MFCENVIIREWFLSQALLSLFSHMEIFRKVYVYFQIIFDININSKCYVDILKIVILKFRYFKLSEKYFTFVVKYHINLFFFPA